MRGFQRSETPIRLQACAARLERRNVVLAHCLAITMIFVGALDAISTEVALMAGGAYEANPLMRALQDALGVWWILPKMFAHGLLAGAIVWFPSRITLVAMGLICALVLAVSINNFTLA